MAFVHTATVQAKNQLWNDVANSAEGRGLLQKVTSTIHGPWAADQRAD